MTTLTSNSEAQASSSRQKLERTMPDLNGQDQDHGGSFYGSQSLPGSEPEESLDSTPPRRASSVFRDRDSNGGTIIVRRTPLFSQASMSENQAHLLDEEQSDVLSQRTRLQTALAGLREQLRTSNGIINNLRTRNQVHELDNTAKDSELQKVQNEHNLALEKAKEDRETRELKNRTLMTVLGLVVLAVVLYCYWCWCFGPEMLYIRQRRLAVLFE